MSTGVVGIEPVSARTCFQIRKSGGHFVIRAGSRNSSAFSESRRPAPRQRTSAASTASAAGHQNEDFHFRNRDSVRALCERPGAVRLSRQAGADHRRLCAGKRHRCNSAADGRSPIGDLEAANGCRQSSRRRRLNRCPRRPDGYTLYIGAASTFTALKGAPGVAPNLPIELPRDFMPIGFITQQPMFIAWRHSSG